MNTIYYIGGSPCSGKTTIAEALAEKYNLQYLKIDDFLDDFTALGAAEGQPICQMWAESTAEELWMCDPEVLCAEEIQYYKEIDKFIINKLNSINNKNGIITEGTAWTPELINKLKINKNNYISITPSPEFQVIQFKQREWVRYALEGCRDQIGAFTNWMGRDILFAEEIQKQCKELGFESLINDGSVPVEELIKKVEKHFEL